MELNDLYDALIAARIRLHYANKEVVNLNKDVDIVTCGENFRSVDAEYALIIAKRRSIARDKQRAYLFAVEEAEQSYSKALEESVIEELKSRYSRRATGVLAVAT